MPDRVRRLIGRGSSADALQRALESVEHAREQGTQAEQAHLQAARDLDPETRGLLALAMGLQQASAVPVAPEFEASLERRLRESAAGVVSLDSARLSRTPARRWSGSLVAAAACIVLVVGLVAGSSGSLPGDGLYPVKRAGEALQVGVRGGTGEALYRLNLAETRLEEAEGLLDRSRDRALAASAHSGQLAAAANRPDARTSRLIKRLLEEAQREISLAASVLILAKDPLILERLVEVAREGQETVARVAQTLSIPALSGKPISDTVQTLQGIAVKAEEARMRITEAPAPTATPCPTPEPTPTPVATPSPSPTPAPKGSPSPTPRPTPTPVPTPTPAPTPCPDATAEPTPAATTAPTEAPTPEPQPTPTPERETPEPEPTQQPQPSSSPQSQEQDQEADSSQASCSLLQRLFAGC
ncbi:MAG TPA: DUF5667 domain-containing protein [Actinomycetota bacterium]|nr:DUF5667 domain-containing protein [Actinomycetota bacterium]